MLSSHIVDDHCEYIFHYHNHICIANKYIFFGVQKYLVPIIVQILY
nr:MAG TPA: hypothetical protein [Caudoviricetes sp.]